VSAWPLALAVVASVASMAAAWRPALAAVASVAAAQGWRLSSLAVAAPPEAQSIVRHLQTISTRRNKDGGRGKPEFETWSESCCEDRCRCSISRARIWAKSLCADGTGSVSPRESAPLLLFVERAMSVALLLGCPTGPAASSTLSTARRFVGGACPCCAS
jgi:hypothetical protein